MPILEFEADSDCPNFIEFQWWFSPDQFPLVLGMTVIAFCIDVVHDSSIVGKGATMPRPTGWIDEFRRGSYKPVDLRKRESCRFSD